MTEANDIFFGTLEQYTTDATAGAAILAAVAAALRDAPSLKATARNDAATNLRWFATRPEGERVQIMALAAAVRKYLTKEDGRQKQTQTPAAFRLDCLQLAAAIYRHLRKKKSAVSTVVEATTIQTRAAYIAIVKSNLPLINQMRATKRTRNWSIISDTLKAITGKTIPPAALSKTYAEAMEQTRRSDALPPMIMSHYENERISTETREAYEQAGYTGIDGSA